MIIDKTFRENITVLSETAQLLTFTTANLKQFFGYNYKKQILFNCFLKSLTLEKHLYKMFLGYFKINKEIQDKVNQFYSEQEESICKTKKKNNFASSQLSFTIHDATSNSKRENKSILLHTKNEQQKT